MGALLVKQFRDRGIGCAAEVVDYLIVRLPRDFAQIAATVARLDAAGLEQRRALTSRSCGRCSTRYRNHLVIINSPAQHIDLIMPISVTNAVLPPEPAYPVDPDRYFNRELSRLAFNLRVLERRTNPNYPLLGACVSIDLKAAIWMSSSHGRVAGLRGQMEEQVSNAERTA